LKLFDDDESQKNAKSTLKFVQDLKKGNGTATLIILDPFGQSSIVSDSAEVSEIPEEELHGLKTGFSIIEE
jgi:zinc finger protein